jgi:putative ABC transport system permease protein
VLAVSSDPMGATLKKDYPQVEQYTRIYASNGPRRIKRGDIFLIENDAVFVDSTFFDVFTFPAIAGNIHTALNEPNTVVITESMASKYFGSVNVVGQTLETNNDGNPLYKVTAVIKDMPYNSHFHFDMMFSMDNVSYQWGNYLSHNFHTYIVLQKGTDYREFEKNFSAIIDNYVMPQGQAYIHATREEFEKAGNKIAYTLMPIKDIHLHSSLAAELDENSNIQYIYIFSAVAIFILLIACVNFMNLSTARSSNRAREVGIRKVLGSERSTIIRQFLAESVFTAFIALGLGLLIAWISLSYFNSISGKDLSLSLLYSSSFLPYLLLLPLLVGVLAGSYPAFYLSSFQPISVLKGKLTTGVKRSRLRSALVVFQFATSIFLIIGTLIVYRQLDYIQTKKLGFNREQVVILNNTSALQENGNAFKNEVLKISGVTGR